MARASDELQDGLGASSLDDLAHPGGNAWAVAGLGVIHASQDQPAGVQKGKGGDDVKRGAHGESMAPFHCPARGTSRRWDIGKVM